MTKKPLRFLDGQLFQILLVFYLVAYVIDFVATLLIYRQEEDFSAGQVAIQYLIFFVSKLSYVVGALVLTRSFFRSGTIRYWMIIVHLALAGLLSFYTAFIGIWVDMALFEKPITMTIESVYIRGLGGLSFNFFMYFSMIAIVYAYNYLQRKKSDDLRTSTLKAELLDSKIRALQAQLNPHFLFNALNDISALIDENTTKAQNAIADLSQLLRKTLRLKDSKLVTLEEELLLLDTYAKMEKLRYDDKWELIKIVPPRLNDRLLPPLLFQPLLENTIKHGFSEQNQKIRTVLAIRENEGQLELEIINNGRPLPFKAPIIGNGIGNILERLDSLYQGRFEFDLTNDQLQTEHFDGPVVCVRMVLPLLKKSDDAPVLKN